MIYDQSEGLNELLRDDSKAYVGFDPTASSLHVGNLATIMLLVHAQRAGYRPVVLLGGATALIGDPSGRSAERPLLEEKTIRRHEEQIREQMTRFLSFEGPFAAELYNNYDWFKDMNLLRFLRDTGKHFPVGYLLGKESTKSRLEKGLSFTEFSYQLMQAYDFYLLYQKKGVRLQMGGSDQWGNITAGIELIRRRLHTQAQGLTTPLITRSDGTKFGKSEGQNIWLDASLTSPYAFYQFWLNQDDKDCYALAKTFSLDEMEALDSLQKAQQQSPAQRPLQRALAQEVTTRVHGESAYRQVLEASDLLFGKKDPQEAPEPTRRAYELLSQEIPFTRVPRSALSDLYVLLCDASGGLICSSRSELRRLIQGRGISINHTPLSSHTQPQELSPALGKYLLLRKGKKSFYLLEIED